MKGFVSNYKWELLLYLVIFADLFLKVLPLVPLAAILLAYSLLKFGRAEIIYLFLLIYPSMLGATMYSIGVNGVGGFSYIVGIVIFIFSFNKLGFDLVSFPKQLLPLLFVLFICFLSSYFSTLSSNSIAKLTKTAIIGLASLTSFCCLFSQNSSDYFRLGLFLSIVSLFVMRVSFVVNNIPGPENIFDIGYMRIQTITFADVDSIRDEGLLRISYHIPGEIALQGLGLFMLKRIRQNTEVLLMFLMTLIPSLYCGARQSIIIMFAILAVWGLFDRRGNKHILLSVVILFGVFMLVSVLTASGGLLESIATDGIGEGANRDMHYKRAIQNFTANPLFGIGYGKDTYLGGYGYAHNIFLELLGEMGLIGFAILLFIAVRVILRYRYLTMNYIFLFICFMGTALASEGFEINVKVFTLLFALPVLAKTELENLSYSQLFNSNDSYE